MIPEGIWVAGIKDQYYMGAKQVQDFRVYDGNQLLELKKDYTVSYKNNTNAYQYDSKDYEKYLTVLQENGKKLKINTFDPLKAPQLVIKMKGNYSNSQTIYFQILPEDISGNDFEASSLEVTWSGKKQTPAPVLLKNGKKLKYGKDYYVREYEQSEDDFTQAGIRELHITGKNNFTGERTIIFTISNDKEEIAMNKVSVKGLKAMTWTGEPLEQSFTASYKNDSLAADRGDYTLEWKDTTKVGKAALILTGTREDRDGDGLRYVGTKTIYFDVKGTSIKQTEITGLEKEYPYTGEKIAPLLQIKLKEAGKEKALIEGIDYKLTYSNNLEKGKATILLEALPESGFSGSRKLSFQIIPRKLDAEGENGFTVLLRENEKELFSETDKSFSYLKGGVKPQVQVVGPDGQKLVLNKDYKITYENIREVRDKEAIKAPTVVIRGQGNYSGTVKVPFTIEKKAASADNNIILIANDKEESSKQGGWKQSFKIYDADGQALTTQDYQVRTAVYQIEELPEGNYGLQEGDILTEKKVSLPAGSKIRITVTLTGKNYEGQVTGSYKILLKGKDISRATIKVLDQIYTGKPIEIKAASQLLTEKVYLVQKGEKIPLILGKDIQVAEGSYGNHTNRGNAKVTFEGIGEYGGKKQVSFKIKAQSVVTTWKGVLQNLISEAFF